MYWLTILYALVPFLVVLLLGLILYVIAPPQAQYGTKRPKSPLIGQWTRPPCMHCSRDISGAWRYTLNKVSFSAAWVCADCERRYEVS